LADQKSEKPTKRRVDKAREEGNYPSSREFISSIHFLGFVTIASTFGSVFVIRTAHVMRLLLVRAFSGDLTLEGLMSIARDVAMPEVAPILMAGAALMLLSVSAQFATTKLGISVSKLTPDIKRLNPFKKIKNLPAQNIPMLLQTLVVLPIIASVVYYEATENLDSFLELPWLAPQAAMVRVGGAVGTLLWRVAGLFLVLGVIDLLWQRHRYTQQLRMSKQEIREESKDQDGNPQMKGRVRRMQRDLLRRSMMKEIAKATAIIVNPTHYAVAIRYSVDAPGAPKVVAKGKNYLAARIRKRAMEFEIPVVENPPLARALYDSVEVGQEIPSHLYRAVAEILAYIYKLMNGRLPGA
jgi:flagellar biosynthetic protein FlhB